MIILFSIIGLIILIVGLLGCILPGLPGVPLSYIAILLMHFFIEDKEFSTLTLIILGILTITSLIIDYLLPLLGAKLYGVSKKGILGSIIGMIIGSIWFPPFGMILGILIGAIIGEIIAGKEDSQAFKAGLAAFLGTLLSMLYQVTLSSIMLIWYIMKLF